MKAENLYEAMNEIDAEFLEASEIYREDKKISKKSRIPRWTKYLAACACLALIIVGGAVTLLNQRMGSSAPKEQAAAGAGDIMNDSGMRKDAMNDSLMEEAAEAEESAPAMDQEAKAITGGSEIIDYYQGDGFTAAQQAREDGGCNWYLLPDEGKDPASLLNDDTVTKLLQGEAVAELIDGTDFTLDRPYLYVVTDKDGVTILTETKNGQ